MSESYDNTNRGALFKNNKQTSERSPTMTGPVNVEGKKFRLAAWTKVSKAGNEYLSLELEPEEVRKEEPDDSNTSNSPPVAPTEDEPEDINDEIPF